MNPVLQQFLVDAREQLDESGRCLLALEQTPDDALQLSSLLRLVHTLKGNAGLFDFALLGGVVHVVEDALVSVRDGELTVDAALIDDLLSTIDFVRRLLDQIEAKGQIAERFNDEGARLIGRLRKRSGQTEVAIPGMSVATKPPPEDWSWLSRLSVDCRAAAFAAAQERGELIAVRYLPDAECFFKDVDPLEVLRTLPGRVGFSIQALTPWPPAAQLNVFQCNLLIDALSSAGREVVTEHFRAMPEQVALYRLPAHALSLSLSKGDPQPAAALPDLAVGTSASTARSAAAVVAVSRPPLSDADERMWWEILNTQRLMLDLTVPPLQWAGRLAALHNTLGALFGLKGDASLGLQLKAAVEQAEHARSYAPLTAFMDRALALQPVPATAAATRVASATPARSPDSASSRATDAQGSARLLGRPESPPAAIAPAPASSAREPLPVEEPKYGRRAEDASGDKAARVLKVPQEKIDRLMDLIGELVVAKNALPYLAARAEDVFGAPDLSRELKAQFAVVHRIAEELQDGIVQVRMLPVGAVFQRFTRLIRDVTKTLGKKVRLTLEGESTEADKNIVEALADPLIHILRNSLDHGIEMPDVRLAAGKPEEGKLMVRASHEGDRVLIEISDDGKGIDPEVVKRKAFEKGLIDEQRLESISDAEAVQLVFAAGFSTAEVVSDLSGRGVGMDVVMTSLEKIGGQVQLSSEKGRGTRVLLRLPKSLTVSTVMMIEVGGQRFGVPIDVVVETVRIDERAIHTLKDRRAVVLREKLVPLLAAKELLTLTSPPRATAGELAVLVARVDGETVGVIVDGFAQTIDVFLKPLEGPLAGIRGFNGTALLGDGSVLLVLNLRELI